MAKRDEQRGTGGDLDELRAKVAALEAKLAALDARLAGDATRLLDVEVLASSTVSDMVAIAQRVEVMAERVEKLWSKVMPLDMNELLRQRKGAAVK